MPAFTSEPASDGANARAAELGIRLIQLPTPFAIGRVNSYLLEDEPLTLVDPGPNSAATLVELERALEGFGHRIEDLGLILVTHQHMDHSGLVKIVADRSGADVAAFGPLRDWLADFARSMEANDDYAERLMAANGVPADVCSVLRAVAATYHGWGATADVTLPLLDGQELRLRDRTLRVAHRPGHSPSDIVFHDPHHAVLFSGDHLLGHVSSNPIITRPLTGPTEPRPQALVSYMKSLRQTAEMDVSVVLTGHGDPVEDHRGLIARRLTMHERRRDRIEELLRERPRSAYELALELWGNVAVTQAFLTISEVLGHVDLLLNDGNVRAIEGADTVMRFEPC
jgi:glyoxylase-like metal-dependent hydrolase (beta-lactamase superfamily II)